MASCRKRKSVEDEQEFFPHKTEKKESRKMLIYIIPKKIPKARLQVLNNLAQRKGFPITLNNREVQVSLKFAKKLINGKRNYFLND